MAIVNSTYEMDGGRHVVERHTDHLVQQYMQSWYAPSAWTREQVDARVTANAGRLEENIAEAEIEKLLGEG